MSNHSPQLLALATEATLVDLGYDALSAEVGSSIGGESAPQFAFERPLP